MKETLAITLGDPSGIGPEIVVKSIQSLQAENDSTRLVVVGNVIVLSQAIDLLKLDLSVNEVSNLDTDYVEGCLNCINVLAPESLVEFGKISAEYGAASLGYMEKAIELALAGEVKGIVTAPVNKESLKLAKSPYIDHTQMLQELTASEDLRTLFITHNLRTFFYSKHIAFKEISQSLSVEKIADFLVDCKNYLHRLGVKRQYIALAALNPHAGDGGLFGDEEQRVLEPAVKLATEKGVSVVGPIPADCVFHQAKEERYDAVLALYHDQGHIANKTLDFHKTVSLTLGLPFLRTSVDHGTAMDIAGKGTASEVSLIEAIKVCEQYGKCYSSSV